MVGNVSTLTAITDVAVCSQAPHRILVATEHGNVHLFADAETPTGIVWGCRGGPLRVGWAGTRAIAWNADPISHQLFILDADGQVRKQHSIPANCDLAPCNGGFFIATSQARLAHYTLARDGSCDREDRHVPAPGSYDAGSLTAANSGTVALRSGGLVQLQTKPSRAWQDVKAGGVAASLSPMGTRLATAWAHEGGAHVHSFVVSDSAVVLETPYAVRALPDVITNLEWSVDESMLVAYARDEGDVRVFFRDGWAPGLWTNSAIQPHFHPSGVISVPKTRDRLIANEPRGAASKTWSRWRETTPETFTVTGAESMRRGDKVVVFEREPRTRPTSIYEIVGAHRKDDDIRGLGYPPVVCRLRLGIAPVTDRLLDINAAALSAIENSENGEIESSTMRALMDRLLIEQPDTLEQMRMYLAAPAAGDAISHHPRTPTASTPAKGATTVAPPEGACSSPTPSLPNDPDHAISTSGSTEGRLNRAASAPLDINRAPESDNGTTRSPNNDRNYRAAVAAATRRQLLEELYDAYMENSSTFLKYDGRVIDSEERAREAKWLQSRGYVNGMISTDNSLSLQLTPNGRDHFEATSIEKAAGPKYVLAGGESPSGIGTFEPLPVPTAVGASGAFESLIGEGVDALLVTAVDVERDAMLHHMSSLEGQYGVVRAPVKDHVYFIGRLGDAVVALVMTRMGASMRDGSTLSINEAIGACRPRAVIAVGMAWGMSTKLRLADVLVSTQIVAFDVARRQASGDIYRAAKPEAGGLLINRFRNVTGWSFARADGRVCAIKDGPVLSGESLVDDLAFKIKLHEEFPDAIGGEMEGTGIYGASAKNRGEWIIVKAICDWADGTKDKRAQPVAAAAAASLVAHVVSERGALVDLPRMAVSQSTAAALRADLIISSGDGPPESDKSRRSPGAHVSLTDRQAADMDADDIVSELRDKVSRAVTSNVGEKAMAFRNAFIDALRELSRRLIEIYVDLDEASEPTMRDELVKVIEGRVSAFIQSSNATYGHGRDATGVARLCVKSGHHIAAVGRAFDLSVHAKLKKARPAPMCAFSSLQAADDRSALAQASGTAGAELALPLAAAAVDPRHYADRNEGVSGTRAMSDEPEYRFDVALSFAGDNKRDKVRAVAEILRDELGAGRVFFDEWFEAELAGHDAQVVLQNIYRKATRVVVTCVCKRYAEKAWTQDEWRAIQAFERDLRDAGSENLRRMRFLPLRFGDGELDGLFDTAIVPDVRNRDPHAIARLIQERLRRARGERPEAGSARAKGSSSTPAYPMQASEAPVPTPFADALVVASAGVAQPWQIRIAAAGAIRSGLLREALLRAATAGADGELDVTTEVLAGSFDALRIHVQREYRRARSSDAPALEGHLPARLSPSAAAVFGDYPALIQEPVLVEDRYGEAALAAVGFSVSDLGLLQRLVSFAGHGAHASVARPTSDDLLRAHEALVERVMGLERADSRLMSKFDTYDRVEPRARAEEQLRSERQRRFDAEEEELEAHATEDEEADSYYPLGLDRRPRNRRN